MTSNALHSASRKTTLRTQHAHEAVDVFNLENLTSKLAVVKPCLAMSVQEDTRMSQYPLVSVEWLNSRLDDPNVVILDASVYLSPAQEGSGRGQFKSGLKQYLEGHIPGARFADLFTEFSDPSSRFPFTRPQKEQFEAAARKLGITRATHVVVYDGLVGQWAARLWWVFTTLGHSRVSVLDGGLRKYLAEGGQPETNTPSYPKSIYRIPGPQRDFAHTALVADIVAGRADGSLICLLQPDDYSGAIAVRKRGGHIPGSVNLPFTRLVNVDDNTLLPPAQLRSVIRSVTPLEGERVVTYCGGGIASTLGALALAVIGYENSLEYDGSLAEWIDDPERAMATGES